MVVFSRLSTRSPQGFGPSGLDETVQLSHRGRRADETTVGIFPLFVGPLTRAENLY